ncbi:MAG TPA: helix-turn-helix domain-containing protein [Methanotrichaceae archaeon]|nr:helix-turn-helix domain-containing protein [Methanotrichaceae archaeon]
MECRTRRATETRREQGAETDYDLYEMISDHSGSSSYELAKLMGWTTGRTRSAIGRLERKGLIKVERAVRNGRSVLSVVPKPWQEFLTPEELEEFRQMEI